MKLTVLGNTPSLKNRKHIAHNPRTGRTFVVTDKAEQKWMDAAKDNLKGQFEGYTMQDYPITVTMTFWWDTLRNRDLDNACASVMDALKHAGIIEDDGYKYVDCIQLNYGGLDKENPRVEIYLDD